METVLRAAIVYLFIFFVMRVVGKKELSGMSAFELVMLMVIGDLIQQGVTQQDTSLTAAVLAVSTIAVMMVAVSYLTLRVPRVTAVTEGLPVIVVRNGRVQRKALEIERVSEDELNEAARQQGIADLRDVVVGVMEADGSFSFVKQTEADRQQQARQEPPAE
jgi:uncharacterized membrane protein YcaP (DUF421 family)